MSTQMYGSMDKFPARCQSCCTLPVRFAFLLLVAVIGCIIVAVLMSVSDIRSSISYKKTDCTIREHILQRNAANETRGALLVTYIPKFNDTKQTQSWAYKTPKWDTYYKSNQTEWLNSFKIGKSYPCYYYPQDSKGEGKPLAMMLPYRTLVIVMIGIAGACLLVVPTIVLVITLKKEKESVSSERNRALFTPHIRTSEQDPLLSQPAKNTAHVQHRYSTDSQ